MILTHRDTIKNLLDGAFEEAGITPYIAITSFPKTEEAMSELEKRAKPHSTGCLFVTWHSEHPGQKAGVIYPNFVDVYSVFLFSNDKSSDDDIIKHYEIARNILNTKYYLYAGEMSPVQSSKNGLFLAILQVGVTNIYQGV